MSRAVGGGRRMVALLALVSLAACDGWRGPASQSVAPAAPPLAPQLWLVQPLDAAGTATASRYVCTDAALREAFQSTRPTVEGRPCTDATPLESRNNSWALRCLVGRQPFMISTASVGDPSEDFRFDFALTPIALGLGASGPAIREGRRFRQIGPCPPGWRIGDRARPGHMPERVRQGLRPSVRPGMPAASK